jgi:Methyltransferase FkbM domain
MLCKQTNVVSAHVADRLMQENFYIIDVGCSGGIDGAWRGFNDRLGGVGIDPNRTEIIRLTQAETNLNIRYYAAFAGLPNSHPVRELYTHCSEFRRNPWLNLAASVASERRSGNDVAIPAKVADLREADTNEALLLGRLDFQVRQVQALKQDFEAMDGHTLLNDRPEFADSAQQFKLAEENLWHQTDLVPDDCRINVADLLDHLKLESVDFIKIDVDGADYEVLVSLEEKLNQMQVLGCALEVNFIGSDRPHHHTFHNTDRLMRKAGFGLFGLTVRPYASASLPAPFLLPYPAQSVQGRPIQGDALYLRDFAFTLDSANADDYSWEKIAKLIALFAMFNLPDQAAETALRFRSQLSPWLDVDKVLDMLAAQIQQGRGKVSNYHDYMAEFAQEDPWFFNAQDR